MAKKRLYEIIKEMSIEEMADYLCRLDCVFANNCEDNCKDCSRRGEYEAAKTALETELEECEPVYVPQIQPVSDSYILDDTRYIFEGKVNFCFNRPGARDIDYSVMVYGAADTPPMQKARERIRERNCRLCVMASECDNSHKKLCKVTITRYKKLDNK